MATDSDRNMHTGPGSTPVPDPTLLTATLVEKAVGSLRELIQAEIAGMRELFAAKFIETEKAVRLHQDVFDRLPQLIDEKVSHLKELSNERFRGVETQFTERDVRVKESATATATAVAAALQAAKEAVGEQNKSFTVSIDKSEKATSEQITQLRIQIDTMTKGVDGKIEDIKERLTRIESIAVGRVEQVTDARSSSVDFRGYIALGISAIAIILIVLDKIPAR